MINPTMELKLSEALGEIAIETPEENPEVRRDADRSEFNRDGTLTPYRCEVCGKVEAIASKEPIHECPSCKNPTFAKVGVDVDGIRQGKYRGQKNASAFLVAICAPTNGEDRMYFYSREQLPTVKTAIVSSDKNYRHRWFSPSKVVQAEMDIVSGLNGSPQARLRPALLHTYTCGAKISAASKVCEAEQQELIILEKNRRTSLEALKSSTDNQPDSAFNKKYYEQKCLEINSGYETMKAEIKNRYYDSSEVEPDTYCDFTIEVSGKTAASWGGCCPKCGRYGISKGEKSYRTRLKRSYYRQAKAALNSMPDKLAEPFLPEMVLLFDPTDSPVAEFEYKHMLEREATDQIWKDLEMVAVPVRNLSGVAVPYIRPALIAPAVSTGWISAKKLTGELTPENNFRKLIW